MTILSVAEVQASPGFDEVPESQIETVIGQVVGLAELEVPELADVVEVSAGVKAVLIQAVRRGVQNPMSVQQETLGDYSFSVGGGGLGSIYLTAREKRLIRHSFRRSMRTVGLVQDDVLRFEPGRLLS